MVLFAIGAAVFTTLAVGLAAVASRGAPESRQRPEGSAAAACRSAAAGSGCRPALAVSQVALCFGLLVGANLMVQSFLAMQRADLGFDHRPILSGARLSGRRCLRRRAGAGGVLSAGRRHAARVAGRVGGGGHHEHSRRRRRLGPAARDRRADGARAMRSACSRSASAPALFDTIGLPLLEGRTFTEQETRESGCRRRDCSINELAQRLVARQQPDRSAHRLPRRRRDSAGCA